MKNITIRGKKFTTNTFNGYVARVGKFDLETQDLANAAAVQAVVKNNLNWIEIFFSAYRKLNGDLKVTGVVLKDYILHHTTGLIYDTAAKKFKLQAVDKRGFKEGAVNNDGVTFSMSLADFQNREKKAATPSTAPLKGSAVITRIESFIEALERGVDLSDQAQAERIEDLLRKLYASASEKVEEAQVQVMADAEKVEEAATVKPSSASRAAPKKATK